MSPSAVMKIVCKNTEIQYNLLFTNYGNYVLSFLELN
jgi:hypothetical protein